MRYDEFNICENIYVIHVVWYGLKPCATSLVIKTRIEIGCKWYV